MKWDSSSQAAAQAFVQKAAERIPQQETSNQKQFGVLMKQMREKLERRGDEILVDAWGNGEKFKKYLSVLCRFSMTKPGNTLGEGVFNAALIYRQMPTAKCLKTFDQWAAKGEHIRKGSSSIDILVPRTVERYGQQATYYNATKVFDVSQTTCRQEGRPSPELNDLDALRSVSNSRLFDILVREDLPDGLEAAYIPKINEVWVQDGLNAQETRAALLRETAHYFFSQASGYERSPQTNFEAYTSAYLVSTYFGLDTREDLMPLPKEAFPDTVKTGAEIRESVSSALRTSRAMCETMEMTLEKLGTQLYTQTEEVIR